MGAVDTRPGGNPRCIGKPLNAREKKVMRLIEQGVLSPVEIAQRLGVKRGHARVILCNMRKKGAAVPDCRTGLLPYLEPMTVVMDRDIAAGLRRQAARKSTTATELLRRIILVVTRDNLFDAIIDDGP